MHHFSKLLLLEYTPAVGGLKELTSRQATLQTFIDIICGIASCTLEDGPAIISTQCVFGAGKHVQDIAKRAHIIDILHSHREQTGWPHSDIAEELQHVWAADNSVHS